MKRIAVGLIVVVGFAVAVVPWFGPPRPVAAPVPVARRAAPAARVPSRVRTLTAAWKRADADGRRALETPLRECLAGKDPGALVRELSPDLLDGPLAAWAIRAWALRDRRAAAAWLANLGDGDVSHAGYVMYGWLQQDRTGLFQYLDSLPEGRWRTNALTCASNDALAGNAGADAVQLLTRLAPAPQRDQMLGWAATAWARSDPAAAAEWAVKVNDPTLQPHLLSSVAMGYAWSDPAGAAAWLANVNPTSLPPEAANVAAIWSRRNAAAAAQWLAQTPTAQQPEVIRAVVSNWAYRDAAAADQWIRSLPAGELQGQCRTILAAAKARFSGQDVPISSLTANVGDPNE